MKQNTVLILGGYGNAGLVIARLLAHHKNIKIILAGRNGQRARSAADQLNAEFNTDCLSSLEVDAASRESLLKAFQQVEVVLVAATTIEYARNVAEAALEAGIDYFDIQISVNSKREVLESLRERILQYGRCFITDGGYRPGIPAAMVRYAASQIDGLESAQVASVFQVNWRERQFSPSSAAEFVDELKSFSLLYLKDGIWTTGSISEFTSVDFGLPFGVKKCGPMFMEEFRPLPELIPSLKNTGFYSAGFSGVIDQVILPMAFMLTMVAPNRSRTLVARLLEWGMKHTTHPPYGAVLHMKAQGPGRSMLMTVAHEDSYIMTAAPVAACLLQYFDGALRKPGLWRQATLVEPVRFFKDIALLGVHVNVEVSSR